MSNNYKSIESLHPDEAKEATVYKYKGDDGLSVYYSSGRMDWYRSDNKMPIDISSYSYWN